MMMHTCLFLYLQSKGVYDACVYSTVLTERDAHRSLDPSLSVSSAVRYGEREREVERRYVFISTVRHGTRRASATSPVPVSLVKRLRYITVRERGEGDVTFLSSWSFSPFADVRQIRMYGIYPREG